DTGRNVEAGRELRVRQHLHAPGPHAHGVAEQVLQVGAELTGELFAEQLDGRQPATDDAVLTREIVRTYVLRRRLVASRRDGTAVDAPQQRIDLLLGEHVLAGHHCITKL